MRPTMTNDVSPENLLTDLHHLAGCGERQARRSLTALLRALGEDFEEQAAEMLSPYPMTAWLALAPGASGPARAWVGLLESGLTEEQAMTVLAVVDDHARRRYGNLVWQDPRRMALRLATDQGLRTGRWHGIHSDQAEAPVAG